MRLQATAKELLNKALKTYQKLTATPQARSYLSVVATLILLIILILLIYPALQHIVKVNKEISDARIIKTALEEKITALEEAQENLATAEDKLPLLDSALPIGSQLPEYLQVIEGLASKHNSKISTVQFTNLPLAVPPKSAVLKTKPLSYTVSLSSTFTDFKDFLADLENYIRVSDVVGFSISKNQQSQIQESLNIDSYFMGIDLLPDRRVGQGTSGTTSGLNP